MVEIVARKVPDAQEARFFGFWETLQAGGGWATGHRASAYPHHADGFGTKPVRFGILPKEVEATYPRVFFVGAIWGPFGPRPALAFGFVSRAPFC